VSLADWLVCHQKRRTAPGRVVVDSDVLGKGGSRSV